MIYTNKEYELLQSTKKFKGVEIHNSNSTNLFYKWKELKVIIDFISQGHNFITYGFSGISYNEEIIIGFLHYKGNQSGLAHLNNFPYKVRKLSLSITRDCEGNSNPAHFGRDCLLPNVEIGKDFLENLEEIYLSSSFSSLNKFKGFLNIIHPYTKVILELGLNGREISIPEIHEYCLRAELVFGGYYPTDWISISNSNLFYLFNKEIYKITFSSAKLKLLEAGPFKIIAGRFIPLSGSSYLQLATLNSIKREKVLIESIDPDILKELMENENKGKLMILDAKSSMEVKICDLSKIRCLPDFLSLLCFGSIKGKRTNIDKIP